MTTEKYGVAFANLHLAIEQEPDGWLIRICDLNQRQTIYITRKPSLLDAKTAAVQFALARLFGPAHRKDSGQMAASLVWNSVPLP